MRCLLCEENKPCRFHSEDKADYNRATQPTETKYPQDVVERAVDEAMQEKVKRVIKVIQDVFESNSIPWLDKAAKAAIKACDEANGLELIKANKKLLDALIWLYDVCIIPEDKNYAAKTNAAFLIAEMTASIPQPTLPSEDECVEIMAKDSNPEWDILSDRIKDMLRCTFRQAYRALVAKGIISS